MLIESLNIFNRKFFTGVFIAIPAVISVLAFLILSNFIVMILRYLDEVILFDAESIAYTYIPVDKGFKIILSGCITAHSNIIDYAQGG